MSIFARSLHSHAIPTIHWQNAQTFISTLFSVLLPLPLGMLLLLISVKNGGAELRIVVVEQHLYTCRGPVHMVPVHSICIQCALHGVAYHDNSFPICAKFCLEFSWNSSAPLCGICGTPSCILFCPLQTSVAAVVPQRSANQLLQVFGGIFHHNWNIPIHIIPYTF